ncbi:MAG: hypothetical protein AB7O59_11255 [Pirellulales bacterium]
MSSPATENPFAAPATDAAQSPFYRVDIRRMTYRELRDCSPSDFAFAIQALAKFLGLPFHFPFGFAHERARVLELGEVSEQLPGELEPLLSQCEAEGFARRFGFQVPLVGDQEGINVVLANRPRTTLCSVIHSRVGKLQETVLVLVSRLSDGRILGTTNSKPRLLAPPGFERVHRVDATAAELIQFHAERLNKLARVTVVELDDVAQRQLLLDNAERIFAFHRARGVWVPMNEPEVRRLRAPQPPEPPEPPAPPEPPPAPRAAH